MSTTTTTRRGHQPRPTLSPLEARIDRVMVIIARDNTKTREATRLALFSALQQHARDQRHACAEAVLSISSDASTDAPRLANLAHAACIDAHLPEPVYSL